MLAEMKRARNLLATSGWVGPELEPWCRDSQGRLCLEDDEGVRRFSVQGALIEAGAWPEGWHLLEAVIAPAHAAAWAFAGSSFAELQRLCRAAVAQPTLKQWLTTWGRTDGEVLALLVEGIKRARKVGERRG